MKIVFCSILLISFSALSCPNLEGHYALCTRDDGSISSRDFVMTQKNVNRVTVYTSESTDEESQERETESIKADGKTYKEVLPDTEGKLTSKLKAYCRGDAFIVKASVLYQGIPFTDQTITFKKTQNGLESTIKGFYGAQKINQIIHCE